MDKPIELNEMASELSDEDVPLPDWSASHLTDEYLQRCGNGDTFIETGTYLGETVELVRRSDRYWKKIFSIELDPNLARMAKKYFYFDDRVNILCGDSVDKIQEVCRILDGPATFWLDAHASGPLPGGMTGPSPLVYELNSIKATGRKDHTIMIDDRRLFGSAEWGGLQEGTIMDLVKVINPDYQIIYLDGEIPRDIICATVTFSDF